MVLSLDMDLIELLLLLAIEISLAVSLSLLVSHSLLLVEFLSIERRNDLGQRAHQLSLPDLHRTKLRCVRVPVLRMDLHELVMGLDKLLKTILHSFLCSMSLSILATPP